MILHDIQIKENLLIRPFPKIFEFFFSSDIVLSISHLNKILNIIGFTYEYLYILIPENFSFFCKKERKEPIQWIGHEHKKWNKSRIFCLAWVDNLVFLSCYNIKVMPIVNALRVQQCRLQIKFNPYNIYYPQLFSERFLRNT